MMARFAVTLLTVGLAVAPVSAIAEDTSTLPQAAGKGVAEAQGITPPTAANSHAMEDGYPVLSIMLGEEGDVVVGLVVNADGSVSDVIVEKSSGFPRLDNAAADGVTKNWRYRPAMKDGKPIAVRTKAQIRWRLTEGPTYGWQVFEMTPDDFPAGARDKGETGMTALLVMFDETGHVTTMRKAASSSYPDLDEAAETIANRWHVTAATVNGKPVKSMIGAVFRWRPAGAAALDSSGKN